MTDEADKQKLINQMVTELMAVPKNDATEDDIIIAFAKAASLLAHVIGEMRGGNGAGYVVLTDIINLIEEYYDTETVVVSDDYYEH